MNKALHSVSHFRLAVAFALSLTQQHADSAFILLVLCFMKSSITQPGFSLPFSIWFLLALTALLANTLERRLPFWQPISFPVDKNCLEECLPASRRAQLPWRVLPGRAVGIPVGTQPHCQGFTGVVIAVCHHDCTGRASPTAGRSLLKSAYKSWLRYENLPELLRCLLWEKN